MNTHAIEHLDLDDYHRHVRVRIPYHVITGSTTGTTLYVQACQIQYRPSDQMRVSLQRFGGEDYRQRSIDRQEDAVFRSTAIADHVHRENVCRQRQGQRPGKP